MKKILLILFALLPMIASAQYWETHVDIDGIYYYLDRMNKEAWVDKCRHFDNNTTVNIPATVEDKGESYSVTRINTYAFKDHTEIINFTIPHSVRHIGQGAFNNTGWYNSQPDETYLYLDNWFVGRKGKLYIKSHNPLNIKEGTRGIIESAMSGFDFITSITIPNSVLYINSYAFCDCSKPTVINIPNSVISIGKGGFLGCSGLTSITIPNSVKSIGYYAFSGCSGLTSIAVESGNTTYDSRNNCNALIETSTNTLIAGCKTTVIPNNVTSIGDWAFDGCSELTSIAVPNSVTNIGDYAFYGCKGLTSVILGNSVGIHIDIGDKAFNSCDNIKDFYCYSETPPSLGFPGKYAFDSYFARHGHTLHVPKNSVLKYKNSYWNDYFYPIIPLTESDPTTGIKKPSSVESHSSYIYTLSGQRVTNPKRGIYIQGGRKVVIK